MLKTIWRWTKRIFLFGFISSFIYLIICKWAMPPMTLTQLASMIDGYGLKKDYVRYDEISSNVKLAAMASEDSYFPIIMVLIGAPLKKVYNQIQRKKIKLQEQVRAPSASKPRKIFFYGRAKVFHDIYARCPKHILH
jgi:monofunctional biosynthetic peptidoglycan transglycosylase